MRALRPAVLLAILSLGCATAPPRPAPPLASAGLNVRQIDLARFALAARITVVNDSGLPWKLQAALTQVTVDGVLSGSDRVALSQTVPPRRSLEIEVPAAAEPIHDGTALREWAEKGEREIPVLVAGAVQLSDGGAIRDLPFSVAGALRPPKLPIVRVSEASLTGTHGARTATFVLSVENPNSFAIPVRAVSCHATLAKGAVAEGLGQGPEQLPAGGTVTYRWSGPVPAGDDAEGRMAQGRLDYRLEGELNLGRIRIPLRFQGPVQASPSPAGA